MQKKSNLPELKKLYSLSLADENKKFWNSAGIAPGLDQVISAVKSYATKELQNGFFGFESRLESYQKSREQLSQLFTGVCSTQICPTLNCASSINLAAWSLPSMDQGNLVTWDNEYSSNAYVWHRFCKTRGLKHRAVKWEEDGSLKTEKLCEQIDQNTKVVTVSWVQSQTGAETDLKMLGEACKRVGAWLVVDAIQGIGAKTMDLENMQGVDLVCTGSHKWLCAPLGAGLLVFVSERSKKLKPFFEGGNTYGKPQETMDLSLAAREDADAFSPGAVPFLMMVAMGAGAGALTSVGLDSVWQQIILQKTQMKERLLAGPWKIYGSQIVEQGNGGLTIQHKSGRSATEAAFEKLVSQNINCSLKPSGLRLSPHAHVAKEEIDQVCGLIDS